MTAPTCDPLTLLRTQPTVTVPEAAAALGISRETAYRWGREGTLPGLIRLGPNTIRVRSADVLALLDGTA